MHHDRFVLSLLVLVLLPAGLSAQQLPAELVSDLRPRDIGPATMSGRVAAIASEPGRPNTLYVGGASSGLWKSTDGGLTWASLFDEQDVLSIGAIAVHPIARETVWVGTGEANPRNSAATGRGVYRSVDGGATWKHIGLPESERISRIVLDPVDPKRAWVGVLGKAWGDSLRRGVFFTADAGKSWYPQLHIDARTGCADLVRDSRNPHKLFAAMWSFRRKPWSFRSGGGGSGLYVTRDEGASWQRLGPEHGMPEGELGRIGIAVAPSNPDIVYALVEAKENVFLRSTDGGRSFEAMAKGEGVSGRPFYYADIHVDPQDPDRVYRLETLVHVSNDGGKTWKQLVGWLVHPDHHAIWIHPEDPRHLISGNDGGLAISRNHGETWRFVPNLPFAQFYHVDVDMEQPYNVFGGLQDNGSWRGPSEAWENGGIRNHHWQELNFGDGFRTLPHAKDGRYGYAMSQEGNLRRWDRVTGERVDIKPVHPEGTKLRFSWNAALALDPHRPDGLWFGSQFVHYSPDRGQSWELRSPDLTSNDPEKQKQHESGGLTPDVTGAENHTTLLCIEPSPLDPGIAWTGSDDGRVHVTQDGGKSWASVEGGLEGAPKGAFVPKVHASRHLKGRAYVVLDDHRRSDVAPYAYVTDDFGKSWRSLVSEGLDGFLHTLVEDPVEPRLLFAGGEFGLFVSLDAGETWARMRNGMPPAPVRGLVVHPREHDLVVGTHGRGVFIYDDIRVLRSLAQKESKLSRTVGEDVALTVLPIAPATLHRVRQTGSSRFPGSGEFRGENPPYGARIDVWLQAPGVKAKKAKGAAEPKADSEDGKPDETAMEKQKKLVLKVHDPVGQLVQRSEHEAHAGLVRLRWDLRGTGDFGPGRKKRGRGTRVLPGRYLATLEYGTTQVQKELVILSDPRLQIAEEERLEKAIALRTTIQRLDELGRYTRRFADLRRELGELKKLAKPDAEAKDEAARAGEPAPKSAEWRSEIVKFEKELDALEEQVWIRPGTRKGIQRNESLGRQWSGLRGSLGSSAERPTQTQRLRLAQLELRHGALVEELRALLEERLRALQAQLPEELRARLDPK